MWLVRDDRTRKDMTVEVVTSGSKTLVIIKQKMRNMSLNDEMQ